MLPCLTLEMLRAHSCVDARTRRTFGMRRFEGGVWCKKGFVQYHYFFSSLF